MNMSRFDSPDSNGSGTALTLECIESVNRISEDQWNELVPGDYPFLRHEFLNALEHTDRVSKATGWLPRHIVLRNAGPEPHLLAVAPMYIKYHSYGEYIFDWAWAESYERLGIDYYPKLVLQTPYTPLIGPKILTAPDSNSKVLRKLLIHSSSNLVKAQGANSIHWLFVTDDEHDELSNCGYITRAGTIQFVWHNNGYSSMDDFLGSLSSRKRKKIRAERKYVARQGITMEAVEGEALTSKHWGAFEMFYESTVDKYFAYKYLSGEFFRMIGETMPENLMMFLASKNGRYIAASLCLRGGNALYGRYWGSDGEYPHLHFETCYYSAIEYCIEHCYSTYDAGTRGDHKLQRGFLAQLGRSGHLLAHDQLHPAIAQYVRAESNRYRKYCDELNAHSAYRRT